MKRVKYWGTSIETRRRKEFANGKFIPQFERFKGKAYEKLEFLESASRLSDLRKSTKQSLRKAIQESQRSVQHSHQ